MEIVELTESVEVFYVEADSFPQGVKAAHEKLHAILGDTGGRKFYGISFLGVDKSIIYRAATRLEIPEEANIFGLSKFTILKGFYFSTMVPNWRTSEKSIADVFRELLRHPDLDPQGYCLEIYPNLEDIQCLVKLED